ncbi:MAG: aspartate carbamoyltransferase regulatory subunit [Bacteroidales bacterium]
MKKTELQVSALENGTVIDHISHGVVLQVVKLLGLEDCEERIYMGANLDSQKYGKKGIIKVANRYFKAEEINKIALISPYASIIEIRDFEVVKKSIVSIPDEIKGIVKCMNPNCITNKESIETRFTVNKAEGELKLKCHFCEKNTVQSSIEFI